MIHFSTGHYCLLSSFPTTKGGSGNDTCVYVYLVRLIVNESVILSDPPFFFVCLSLLQDVSKTLASLDFEMLDRLAVKCTKVHEENLEQLRQQYYDDVTSKGPNSQTETTSK